MKNVYDSAGRINSALIMFVYAAVMAALFITPAWPQMKQVHPHSIIPPPVPPREIMEELSFVRWQCKDVINAFKKNKLEVAAIAESFVVGAPSAKENVIFLTPSYGKDFGGLVASFNAKDDLDFAVKHYMRMNSGRKSRAWWIYSKDNILLLVSGRVPEVSAMAYRDVLNDIASYK